LRGSSLSSGGFMDDAADIALSIENPWGRIGDEKNHQRDYSQSTCRAFGEQHGDHHLHFSSIRSRSLPFSTSGGIEGANRCRRANVVAQAICRRKRREYYCTHRRPTRPMYSNVWQWTDEFVDEHTRAAIVRGGSYYQPQGSFWYFPQAYPNDEHGKLLLMAPGMDRSATVGFRCVKDARN